jgi:hypothetical protein
MRVGLRARYSGLGLRRGIGSATLGVPTRNTCVRGVAGGTLGRRMILGGAGAGAGAGASVRGVPTRSICGVPLRAVSPDGIRMIEGLAERIGGEATRSVARV